MEGKDIEKGDPKPASVVGKEKPGYEGLDEFAALQKYITTYKDPKASAAAEAAADHDASAGKKKPWYKFGSSGDSAADDAAASVVPEEWLDVDIKSGIRNNDVESRRKRYGFNEIMSEKENMFLKFLSYFQGPVLYVMEIAVIIAAGIQDWIDLGVICGILMLNAIVGWYQEKQAADVVASLKGDIAMKAVVVREGREVEIKAREIVPGDIIVVEEGQTTPADARLICDYYKPEDFAIYKQMKQEHKFDDIDEDPDKKDDEEDPIMHTGVPILACDQSAITGESLAVDKYMGDVIYYTTGCKRGKGYGVCISSAKHSFVGRTASLVQGAKDQGHFKAIMNSIGISLLVLVVFWILAAWIGGFFHHFKIATPMEDPNTLLRYALALLIVGVPVGLPVVTTTTLAVGAAYLAKEKAIVQKLTAIESLAGVDVLCSDKTGTLTANQLSIREPYVAEGQDVNWMMAVAALASSHNLKSLDPIDKVTILTLKRYPKSREILQGNWRTEKFIPFDPVSKRITSICYLDNDKYVCAKGAPKAILQLANCDQATADHYRDKATEFARRGFRSLGVACQKNDGDWILLGMLSLFDPPREDTAQTIIEAQQLGVPVKMLTGDAIAIAKETCKMLALGSKVYNSTKLIHGGLTGTTQHDLVERADGFAEVFPEHKYQVVEMLQQRGHLTAMTGDGVNDAPSLKKADCGIAVEGATEAAQAAADIVFLAPGLSTIVLAIKIARQIFQRMKAYIQYRIALCLHLEIYIVLSIIIIKETLETDLVVFIALFADLATVAVAYDNAHSEDRPVEWQLPKIWIISVVLGCILAAGTWIIRATLFQENGGIVQKYGNVQEILFLEIALTENWLIFVTRGGKTWPSWQLVGAILVVDVIASLFAGFGWLALKQVQVTSPPTKMIQRPDNRVDIVTIVVIWVYSLGITIIVAIVYYLLNRIQWLNDLGRKDRSRKDAHVENVIAALSKVAIEHSHDKDGVQRYTIGAKAIEEEEE